MTESIPLLSLKEFFDNKQSFVQSLGQGYEAWGFCAITDHGIPDDILDSAYQTIKAFFALPVEVKRQYFVEGTGGARGYTPFGIEVAKDSTHHDLKEFWHVGRELPPNHSMQSIMQPNIWPAEVEDFKTHVYQLFEALDNLGNTLLKALALYLDLDEDYFADKTHYGNSILRAIHYPPIEDTSTPSIRAGQHEDINVITLLIGSNEPGLEILNKQHQWVPVTTIEGAIVCNIGDMLQRLTNHILPSTTHRVVNPAGEFAKTSRYSIPYFLHFNPDVVIETLTSCISEKNPNKYPEPITANDYLLQRLREIKLL